MSNSDADKTWGTKHTSKFSKDEGREPSWLVEVAEDSHPVAAPLVWEGVSINLEEAWGRFIQTYYRRVKHVAERFGGQVDFDVEDLDRYCQTIIDSRVKHTTRDRFGVAPLIRYNTMAAVPTMVEKIISSIGIVEMKEVGIILYPTFTPRVELMSKSEFNDMTTLLKSVAEMGITTAPAAYDRKIEGSPDFMVMQYLNDVSASRGNGVYAHSQAASPVYAPLALLAGLRQMQSLLGERVFYMHESVLEAHFVRLASA